MHRQHDRATDQQTISDVKVRPSVLFVAKQNPIAHAASPIRMIRGRIPQPQTIVQVAEDPTRDTTERHYQPPALDRLELAQPNQDGHRRHNGQHREQFSPASPHTKQRTWIHRGLDTNVRLD